MLGSREVYHLCNLLHNARIQSHYDKIDNLHNYVKLDFDFLSFIHIALFKIFFKSIFLILIIRTKLKLYLVSHSSMSSHFPLVLFIWYPFGQIQVYDPWELTQTRFGAPNVSQSFFESSSHSLISVQFSRGLPSNPGLQPQ